LVFDELFALAEKKRLNDRTNRREKNAAYRTTSYERLLDMLLKWIQQLLPKISFNKHEKIRHWSYDEPM